MMQEFVDRINQTVQKNIDGIHTALPGEITAYDPETGLATVQPKAQFKKPNGEAMNFPPITGVPIVFPQSKAATIAWPVKAGDGCLLIFAEAALDYWMYGRETDTALKFDLSNAIAVPGLLAAGNAAMREACEEGAVVIESGSTSLMVSPDAVYIAGNLIVSGSVTAVGEVKARSGKVSLAAHQHSLDSGGTTSVPF